jgi:hypothetical protein
VSLKVLDEMTIPNSGVSNITGIIRRLAEKNGIPNTSGKSPSCVSFSSSLELADLSIDIVWDGQTPNSQDLDALCRMFPITSPNFNDFMQPQSLTSFGSYGYDPLQGFMDIYMPPLSTDPSLHSDFLDPKEGSN